MTAPSDSKVERVARAISDALYSYDLSERIPLLNDGQAWTAARAAIAACEAGEESPSAIGMRHIAIHVIDHSQQRYCTAGDWQHEAAGLKICVSDTGSWEMNMLVAFHELAEAILCKARGIGAEAVDAFDMEFEARRRGFEGRGLPVTGEPGDHPDAPYAREHFFATTVERLLAAELGVDWIEYEDRIAALPAFDLAAIHDAGHGTYIDRECPECAELMAARRSRNA